MVFYAKSEKNLFLAFQNSTASEESLSRIDWIIEFNTWASMLKQSLLMVFINYNPCCLYCNFRVVAKPGSKGLGKNIRKSYSNFFNHVAIILLPHFWIVIIKNR